MESPQPKRRKLLGVLFILLGGFVVVLPHIFKLVPDRTPLWDTPWSLGLLLIFAGELFLKKPKPPSPGHWIAIWAWLGFLFFIAIGVLFTVAVWAEDQAGPFQFFVGPWLPLTLIGAVFVTKFFRGFTWVDALSMTSVLEWRDERERTILERATRLAFGVTTLIVLIAMSLVIFLPAPSKGALIGLFFILMNLMHGLRAFIAWAMNR